MNSVKINRRAHKGSLHESGIRVSCNARPTLRIRRILLDDLHKLYALMPGMCSRKCRGKAGTKYLPILKLGPAFSMGANHGKDNLLCMPTLKMLLGISFYNFSKY